VTAHRLCVLTISVFLLGAVGFSQSAEPFSAVLEFRTLDQINAEEGRYSDADRYRPFELNTAESQIRLVGGLYGNYPQGGSHALDSIRGLLYIPEVEHGWQSDNVGSIAVVDTQALTVLRRMVIQSGTQQARPVSLALDPLGNRLFVTSGAIWNGLWIADALSGLVHDTVATAPNFFGRPYVAATNRLYGWSGPTNPFDLRIAALDLADPHAPLEIAAPTMNNSEYLVINEESKLMYFGVHPDLPEGVAADLLPDSQVVALDIDPGSPSFHQVVWTGSGSLTRARSHFLPALDRVRQRLYVPDVKDRVMRVFDARRGATLHQELPSIPLDLTIPADLQAQLIQFTVPPHRWDALVRWSVVPEVDPITGLIYAVVSSELGILDDYYSHTLGNHVEAVTIHPSLGTVGRAFLGNMTHIWGSHMITLDPRSRRIFVVIHDTSTIAVLEDLRSSVIATPADETSVTVTAPEATITFASVSTGGTTTIEPRSIAGLDVNLPGQFTIEAGLLYEVSTTATISGSIALCFSAAHVNDASGFQALRVLHAENGQWVDRTTSRNFDTRTICAQTSSLSPFAIARLTTPAYAPRLLYSVERAYKAGSTAPIKVQVLDWSGANVSTASLSLRAASLSRTGSQTPLTIADAGAANADSGFRYDPSLQGYIFNLSTRGLAPGTYTLTAEVGEPGQFIQLPFSVR
jgi:hypothetical protein